MKPASGEHRYFVNLFVFYLIAHGGILLIPNAIYWDDWVLYGVSSQSIYRTFQMSGSMFNLFGHLHVSMLTVGPWLYRILTFVLMFASGMLLWQIAKRQQWVSIDARYAIVLLFLVLPFNDARAALIVLPNALGYFLFFLAWYFLGKNRPLVLALFFLSFNINSMLVFYALPIAEWYFRDEHSLRLKTAWRWALRRIDFMILPFVYWFIKTTYFKPYGVYAGYNEDFSLKNLILSLIFLGDDFMQLQVSVILLFAFLAFASLFIAKPDFHESNHQGKLQLAGIAAFVCAVFPYCVVGAVPTFGMWESHNQLLMPLGVALLLVWLLARFPLKIRQAAFTLLVALSLALNVEVYTVLYQDWGKKKELISLIRKDDRIREARLVVFDDRTELYRTIRYPFYEWNGLMKLAYKDETRFGLVPPQVNLYLRGGYDHYFHFDLAWNARNHVRELNQKSVVVTIEDAGRPSTYGKLMRLIRGQSNYSLSVNSR